MTLVTLVISGLFRLKLENPDFAGCKLHRTCGISANNSTKWKHNSTRIESELASPTKFSKWAGAHEGLPANVFVKNPKVQNSFTLDCFLEDAWLFSESPCSTQAIASDLLVSDTPCTPLPCDTPRPRCHAAL